ncbi:alpha/beta fold hydrolase [Streptomyces fructofermentans]|uniref:Alpha/beta hydrolase n=1 Tax=Streptomyces fructofermentans TaxID=152141 RepID=A0A918KD75_9ACTN|nr:alpha/beta family hydrolase [Streptomyces fructofermentans]GGX57755.1 alpha/beta hydrolase [Streptomyces fructofermentans]
MLRYLGAASAGAALRVRHRPLRARAAVITLHGGRAESREAAYPWHPAALRMRPVLRAAASAVSLDDVLLAYVQYRHRGWNEADPADDALRALGELDLLTGGLPVVLIGHSMGGRAALRAASHPQVRGVLALAPWLPADEPTAHLRGKRVVVLHGDRDRVTRVDDSADFTRRARASGAAAGMLVMRNGDHAMLRRSRSWHAVAASVVADLLRPPARPDGLAARSCAAPGALSL